MGNNDLGNFRILVVEDEYLLADELLGNLEEAGAIVVGPVGTIADALEIIDAETRVDMAVLDANLQGEMAFPVAERLEKRGIPYLFTTGYDASIIPYRFEKVERLEKPISSVKLYKALALIAPEH